MPSIRSFPIVSNKHYHQTLFTISASLYKNVYYELEYQQNSQFGKKKMKIENFFFALPKLLFGELTDTDTEYSAGTYFGPSLPTSLFMLILSSKEENIRHALY